VTGLPNTVSETARLLADHGYIADRELATTVHLSLTMQRPLFLEGDRHRAEPFGPAVAL
jgi:MoxR-like ATPase